MESVEIRPRISGYIQEVRFQSGQLVKKGDVLFVIDPRWNQATVDQRQAEYEQAKSENRPDGAPCSRTTPSRPRRKPARGRPVTTVRARPILESAQLDLEYTGSPRATSAGA